MKKILLVILVLAVAKWWFTDPTVSVASNGVSFSYVVKYAGNGGRGDPLPMLVALHGNGDTSGHFYDTALDLFKVPTRIILLKGPISAGGGNSWPWTPADFKQYGDAVSEAVDALAVKYPTTGKPILLGFSGGGMMAYYQAVTHGDSYSYVFPVSGQLSNELLGDQAFRPGAKVFAFHGSNDRVISVNGGREAANILQKNGVNVRLTEFDGDHHGLFTSMKPEITHAVEQKLLSIN